jgi:predicted phage terminase large subunit-like protein
MAVRGAPKRPPARPLLRRRRVKPAKPEPETEIGLTIEQTAVPLSELDAVNREIENRKLQASQREAERQRALREIERRLKIQEARKGLVAFTEFAMPDPNDPDDATRSRYDAQYFHRALAAALEEVEAGKLLRLIVTFPPRHGKSELTSRKFPAWLAGRDPYRHVIFATYNQDFAEDFGRDVRSCIISDRFAATFPGVTLRKGETAADRLRTEEGGLLAFVGRGGSITGRGADFLIIDDPLKDRAEAQSATIRNELWSWFNDTAMTRLMSDVGAVIIIMTRWHEDDLVGRLTDPANPYYNPAEAKNWKIINIPALAEQNDVLGRKPGEPLWPQRFGKAHLESIRNRNPVGFSALYQQRPSPDDGDYFKAAMIRTYLPHELPGRLRVYVGSDHAVDKKQRNDENVILTVGIDEHDVMWVLDCWWKRAKTDETVEEMLATMKRWRPITWWSGKDHITKSIGPFLTARMRKEKVYISIVELSDSKDKEQKAQAIQGRMAMGMVRFPKTAWWYEKARDQLLKFPNGSLDDFVDALSNIGRGLPYLHGAAGQTKNIKGPPRVGTLSWVKADHNYRRGIEKRQAQLRSM